MELLTIKQVASQLQVTEQCVYNWIREGKLKSLKIGRVVRVDRNDLYTFVRQSSITPAEA